MTGLASGDELRTTSTITFSATASGATTFVDCLGEVEEAVLNGKPLVNGSPPHGRIELPDLEPDNVWSCARCSAVPPKARACTVQWTPVTARSTSGRVSSRMTPEWSLPASTNPISRRSSASPCWRPTVVGHEQHRPRVDQHGRRCEHVGLCRHATAFDVRPGGQRRTVRRAAQHAQWLRSRPLRAALSRTDAGARRRGALRSHREGAGVLWRSVRAAVPSVALRPGFRTRVRRCDGELRLRHLE